MATSADLDAGTLIVKVPKATCIAGVSAHCEEAAAIAAKCSPVLDLVFEGETDWWRLIITVLVEQVSAGRAATPANKKTRDACYQRGGRTANATRLEDYRLVEWLAKRVARLCRANTLASAKEHPPFFCGGLADTGRLVAVLQVKCETGEPSYWWEMLRTVGNGGASPDASSYQWCVLSCCWPPASCCWREKH